MEDFTEDSLKYKRTKKQKVKMLRAMMDEFRSFDICLISIPETN